MNSMHNTHLDAFLSSIIYQSRFFMLFPIYPIGDGRAAGNMYRPFLLPYGSTVTWIISQIPKNVSFMHT